MRWFLFILIFAFGNAWTTEPQHPQTNSRKQQAKNEQRGAEQSPVFINGEVTVKKDKQEADSDANYGKTPGIVEGVFCEISKGVDETPEEPLFVERVHWLLRAPIFAPGERRDDLPETVPSGIDFHPSVGFGGEQVPLLELSENLFFKITIHYRGPITTGHETSACWVLDKDTNRFVQVGCDEHHYTE